MFHCFAFLLRGELSILPVFYYLPFALVFFMFFFYSVSSFLFSFLISMALTVLSVMPSLACASYNLVFIFCNGFVFLVSSLIPVT